MDAQRKITTPFISVIIPTHNRLSQLKQVLACLAQQTYPAPQFEVIVIDDGSEDGTADYLATLAVEGKMRYISQLAQGPATARNRGVELARGDIVAFTDDDCLPETTWLTALAETYTTATDDLVAVGGRVENVADGHWLYQFYALQKRHGEPNQTVPRYLDTANASFQRAVFLAMGGFDERIPLAAGEDVDLGLRLTLAGYGLTINPQALVWHTGHTTLRQFMRHSFIRGRGNAFLHLTYPQFFPDPPSDGLYRYLKGGLQRLLKLSRPFSSPVRRFIAGWVAALQQTLTALVLEWFFITTTLPQLWHTYRAQNVRLTWRYLYLCLAWLDYSLQRVGVIVGIFYLRSNSDLDD